MHNERHLPAENNAHLNPALLLDIFGDMDFPAERASIWAHARRHKADERVMARIKHMPEKSYRNMEQFRQAFSAELENYGQTR